MVNVKDLAEYEIRQQLCSRFGRGANKSIDVIVKHKKVTYAVKSQKETILITPSLASAVAEYNNI